MPSSHFLTAIIRSPQFNDITKEQRLYTENLSSRLECIFDTHHAVSEEKMFAWVCGSVHPVQLYSMRFDAQQVDFIVNEMQKQIASLQYCVDNDLSEYAMSDEFYNEYVALYNEVKDNPEEFRLHDNTHDILYSRGTILRPRKQPDYDKWRKPAKKYKKREVIPKEHNKFNRNWELLDKVCVDDTIRSRIRQSKCLYREVNEGVYQLQGENDDLTFPVKDLLANAIAVERVSAKLRRNASKVVIAKRGNEIRRTIPKGLRVCFPDGSYVTGDGELQGTLTEINQAQKQRSKEQARKRRASKGIDGYLQTVRILIDKFYSMDFSIKGIRLAYDSDTRETYVSYSEYRKLSKTSTLFKEALLCRYPVGFPKEDGTVIEEGETYVRSVITLHQYFQKIEEVTRAKLRRQREEVNAVVSPVQALVEKDLLRENPNYNEDYEMRVTHGLRRPVTIKKVLADDRIGGFTPARSEIFPRKMGRDMNTGRWGELDETPLESYAKTAQFNENSKEAQQFLMYDRKCKLKPLNLNRCVELLKISTTPFFQKTEPTFVKFDKGTSSLPKPELDRELFNRKYVATYEVRGPERFLIQQLALRMGMNGVTLVCGEEVAKIWYNEKCYLTTTTDVPVCGYKWMLVGCATSACDGHLRTKDGLFSFPSLVRVESQRYAVFNTKLDSGVEVRVGGYYHTIDCEGDYVAQITGQCMRQSKTTHQRILNSYLQGLRPGVGQASVERRISTLTLATDYIYFKYHEMRKGFEQPFMVYYDKQAWSGLQENIQEKLESISSKSLTELSCITRQPVADRWNCKDIFCRLDGLSYKQIYMPKQECLYSYSGILAYFVRIGTFPEFEDEVRLATLDDKADVRYHSYYTLSDQCCCPAFLIHERGEWFLIAEKNVLSRWRACSYLRFSFEFNEAATETDLFYAEKFFGQAARACIEKPICSSYKKFIFSEKLDAFEEKSFVIPPKTVRQTKPDEKLSDFQKLIWRHRYRNYNEYLTLDEFAWLTETGQFQAYLDSVPEIGYYGCRTHSRDAQYLDVLACIYYGRKEDQETIDRMNRERDAMRMKLATKAFEERGNYKKQCAITKTSVAKAIVYIYRHDRSYFEGNYQREIDWAFDWTKHFACSDAIEVVDNNLVGFSGLGEVAPSNCIVFDDEPDTEEEKDEGKNKDTVYSDSSSEEESTEDEPQPKKRVTIFG